MKTCQKIALRKNLGIRMRILKQQLLKVDLPRPFPKYIESKTNEDIQNKIHIYYRKQSYFFQITKLFEATIIINETTYIK